MIDPVYAPTSGKNPLRIEITSTGARTALGDMAGTGWIRVKVRGTRAQFFFHNADEGECVLDSVVPEEIGWELLDGQGEDYYITNQTYIVWDAAGNGTIDIMRSGMNRVRGNAL